MFKFLNTIKEIKKLRVMKPSEAWLKKERARFAALSRGETVKLSRAPLFTWAKFTPLVSLVLVLALIAGVVNSAKAALPDDILYPVKLLTEKFQSFVIVGNKNRVDFALKIAEERLEEAGLSSKESAVLGTIERAGDKIEEASLMLEEISLKQTSPSPAKNSKKIEQALKRIEKLEEKKKHLAEKFENKLPKAVKALEKLGAVSVNVAEGENKITVVFSFNAISTATTTPDDGDDNDDDNSGKGPSGNHGTEKIIELLTDGAGKSGKNPPGIFEAPGIRKKLADFFDFDDADEDEDGDDEDEDDEDNEDEEDNDDDNADTTAPLISSVSATNIASTSALVSWVTDEPADGEVLYSTSSPVDLSSANTVATSTLSANHSFLLDGLTASTTYYFWVESQDASGNKATSSESSFTTAED